MTKIRPSGGYRTTASFMAGGRAESAGINRHRVGDERAPHERAGGTGRWDVVKKLNIFRPLLIKRHPQPRSDLMSLT